jgi:predicted HicB family RNase H-like nuclease
MMTNDGDNTTNDDKVNFTLRITRSVDQKITEASSEMGVSKNAFILMILSEKFKVSN